MNWFDFREGSAIERFVGTGFRGFIPSIAWAFSLALMIGSVHPFLHLLGASGAVISASALPALVDGNFQWRKLPKVFATEIPLIVIGSLLATGFALTNFVPIGFLLIFWTSWVCLSGYVKASFKAPEIRPVVALVQASTTRPARVIAIIASQSLLPLLFPVFVLAGLTISQSFCHAATFGMYEREV